MPEHKSRADFKNYVKYTFVFSTISRKSLRNTEVVLGKQKYQNTRKTFSEDTHKLRTIKSSSRSSSSNKNRECLSSMLPEAFLMQNKRVKFKTKCLTGEKYINTPRLIASICGHEWDQTKYTKTTLCDFTQPW